MNEYEKEIFHWLEDAGLNPVHHNMAVPHLEVSAQCGLPTELGDVDPIRYRAIPVELLRMGTILSVDVRGDSMEDAGIYEGNRIEVLLTDNECGVRDGDVVVADVDGGVTVANAQSLYDAGVDVLVSGSTVFKSPDPLATINEILGK